MQTVDLFEVASQLGSVRAFADAVVEDVADGRCCIILVPDGVDPSPVERGIIGRMAELGLPFERVVMPELPTGEDLLPIIVDYLSVAWPDYPITASNLARCLDLPSIILLSGSWTLEGSLLGACIDLITDWATAPLPSDLGFYPTSSALCAIFKATDALDLPLDPRSPKLSIRHWWGFPSALEVRLICRLESLIRAQRGATARWREHLLASLAGNDLSLVQTLWDCAELSVEQIYDRLVRDAHDRGWTASALERWGVDYFLNGDHSSHSQSSSPDTPRLRILWANGVLSCTTEDGLELHSSALAILGQRDQLEHRVWRGQSTLLLPVIEAIRSRLCDGMTRKHGPGWPNWYAAKRPDTFSDGPESLTCEISHIENLLKTSRRDSEEQAWLAVAHNARVLRNRLAHGQTVAFGEYQKLIRDSLEASLLNRSAWW